MHLHAILAYLILLFGCNSFAAVPSPANIGDVFSKLNPCMVTDALGCAPGIEKCVHCDIDSDGQITRYCVKLEIVEGTLCDLKKHPGCKCGPGIYQQYDEPWVSPIRVLMDPTLNPSCYKDADCQARNLGQSCAICEFSKGPRKLCSDDRKGKEDRFWCQDPRCTCEVKVGTMKQEQGQPVATSWETPLTSGEEMDRSLTGLPSPSYYIPGDGSIRGTGSETENPFDQSISGQTFNAMNYEGNNNAQASDEDHLFFN